jgi:hypothetical protein
MLSEKVEFSESSARKNVLIIEKLPIFRIAIHGNSSMFRAPTPIFL